MYCKLPTNGKQLPAFPLEPMRGSNPGLRGGRRECYHSATVAPFTAMDKGSVLKILNISELYGMAPGARLNKDKSVAILVGGWGVQKISWYG